MEDLLNWAHNSGIKTYTDEDEKNLISWAKSDHSEHNYNYFYYIIFFILVVVILIALILWYRKTINTKNKPLDNSNPVDAESGEAEYEVDEEGNIIEYLDD